MQFFGYYQLLNATFVKQRLSTLKPYFLNVILLLILSSIITTVSTNAYSKEKYDPTAIQLVYLYHFINFIKWPDELESKTDLPFSLCFDDQTYISNHIKKLTEKTVRDRKIISQTISNIKSLSNCNIVIINNSSQKRQNAILKAIEGKPILSVGNTKSFTQSGGIIQFDVHHSQVTFSVNLYIAKKSGLKISANMLDVAKDVIR